MGIVKRSASSVLFVIAVLVAAASPLVPARTDAAGLNSAFPGWPATYQGVPITELPVSEREVEFGKDFPGRIGRFSDGQREIILRWVRSPTRRLHPSADCFRGIGYAISPRPLEHDGQGRGMGCFRATRDGSDLMICELIRDERGQSWSDVSAWYWDTIWGAQPGPWWSEVVAVSVGSPPLDQRLSTQHRRL